VLISSIALIKEYPDYHFQFGKFFNESANLEKINLQMFFGSYVSEFSIGSRTGLAPNGDQPLPEPMNIYATKISQSQWVTI